MRFALLALTFLLASAMPSLAEDITCRANDRHFVTAVDNDDIGQNFTVIHKATPDEALLCVHDPATADLVIDDGWYHFEAFQGDFLVLTEGSSPEYFVVVIELDKGKKLVETEAYYDWTSNQSVTYWERREPATAANCDKFEDFGGSGVISHETVFSFATRRAEPTGNTRCDYLQ